MALTDAKARQAVPRAKSYTLSDSDGLLLFVAPNGAKYWHFRFSWKGKRVRISFGSYPLIGLRQARLLRDEARVRLTRVLAALRAGAAIVMMEHSPHWPSAGSPSSLRVGRIRPRGLPGR